MSEELAAMVELAMPELGAGAEVAGQADPHDAFDKGDISIHSGHFSIPAVWHWFAERKLFV